MPIKILHTADLHIGMSFTGYPEKIRKELQQARVDVLTRLVAKANDEECHLFVVAGDLLNGIRIEKKVLGSVIHCLEGFHGECVAILPGNHDYWNEVIDLWKDFEDQSLSKILLLKEEKIYSLKEYGLDVAIYPAPCHSKHSNENNIGWIKELKDLGSEKVHIGIAHGALEGISPDLDEHYFAMSLKELEECPLDLWLLGHTHIPYPMNDEVKEWKVFNPGTPEPDGLDCKHHGNAWILTIDDEKKVLAKRMKTGKFQFLEKEYEINGVESFERIKEDLLGGEAHRKLVRLILAGRVKSDVYQMRTDLYRDIQMKLGYLQIDDSKLGIKITHEKIQEEFVKGSFPQKMLEDLSEDEDALQIAYELIMEVKNEHSKL